MQSPVNHYPSMTTFAGLTSRAVAILEEDGSIRLGDFVNAITKGTPKIKYGAYLSSYWPHFARVTAGQKWSIYEGLLAHLEHAKGPLVCQQDRPPVCPCGTVWGYAAHSDSKEKLARAAVLSSPDRRWRALEAGHPDDRFAMTCGTMPKTSWSCIDASPEPLPAWTSASASESALLQAFLSSSPYV